MKRGRALYGLIAFFLVGGLLLLAGATYAWVDEHSGTPGKARITHCRSRHVSNRTSVSCDATWVYNDHTVSGWVQNAKKYEDGKVISVRIHGADHVTRVTYWVPIGLALMGLFVGGVGVWFLIRTLRGAQTI